MKPVFKPSYLTAAIASAGILALYVATLGPSTAQWDTSEYIAVAHVLGLPHPPGNPLFVLLGKVFTLLPIAPTIAMRVNLLAAVSSALAAGFWFLVTERVLWGWVECAWRRRAGAAAAALIGATTFTVWSQSVVNEKVYTVSLVGLALVSWLTIRWLDDPDSPRADRILVLIAYLLGLGYANHMAGLLAAPAVAAAVLSRRPTVLRRKRVLVACAAALVFGATPFLMEPIRAAHFPPINEGEPTACVQKLELSCTLSATTYRRLKDNIDRVQYGKPPLLDRQAPVTAQVGMWLLYFKWQWLRDADGRQPLAQSALAALFLALGALGGVVHWRRDRRTFWYVAPLMGSVTLALIYYMNFKYGASQAPALGDAVAREVRDRDYFFIWSFSAWGIWAALGLVTVWGATAEALGRAGPKRLTSARWALAAPVLALAFVPLAGNWTAADRRGDHTVREYARDLLNSVEPYGVIFTGGDNDTFPLWYMQEVEGVRRDVTVLVTSYLGLDWYARQLIRQRVRPYDASRGPGIYRAGPWTPPTRPVLAMTMGEADSVPDYVMLREPQRFVHDSLVAEIEPGVLTRDQLLVLRAIRDSSGERPIYFSRGAGDYPFRIGLGPYLVTQGLARKLLRAPAAGRPGIVLSPGDGYLDVPRTRALFDSVYTGHRVMTERGRWVDRPSINLPFTYIDSGARLANALEQMGDTAAADRAMREALGLAEAVGLGIGNRESGTGDRE
jgi:hypothetical protein